MTKVLLIDDDPIEHKLFETYMIKEFGEDYELLEAQTLDQGLEEIVADDFDGVFVDNRLKPFSSYRETLPTLLGKQIQSKVYLISACTTDLQDALIEFPISGILNKFDIKNAIGDGLLGGVLNG